jgi:hypothetical protein
MGFNSSQINELTLPFDSNKQVSNQNESTLPLDLLQKIQELEASHSPVSLCFNNEERLIFGQ